MGNRRGAYRVSVGRPEGMNQLQDLGVDGIILKWMFEKRDEEAWIGFFWLRIGKGGARL